MKIPITITTQPTDTTCGPTSLHAIYRYYNDDITLEQTVKEVEYLKSGGTIAVLLGCHALQRGYRVKIFTYNIIVFDPTWFQSKQVNLIEKLRLQMEKKKDPKLLEASKAYIKFLELGGTLMFQNLTHPLLRQYLDRGIPLLTGLSATYLYQSTRDYTDANDVSHDDDIIGQPSGHFVVLAGYDEHSRMLVADPYTEQNSNTNMYAVNATRLMNSMMLGIVTYDANFMVIEPVKGTSLFNRAPTTYKPAFVPAKSNDRLNNA